MVQRSLIGTDIGMHQIKKQRLERSLRSHPSLHVGDCVPFYFCPRSVMLYVIFQKNYPELNYSGGQGPIIHLEADLKQTIEWADRKSRRWAFTPSNAASSYFEDYADLAQLEKIDWDAVQKEYWFNCKEGKQAEFLLEREFPWQLVSRIGVHSQLISDKISMALQTLDHKPTVEIKANWYY